MSPSAFLSSALFRRLLSVPAALLLGLAALAAPVHAQAQRANILFILVDDMDAALFRHMPKTQRLLGDAGVSFDNSFVSLSLCCPSRASTLRGQFAHNTGIFTGHWPDGGFMKFNRDGLERSTLATWLQGAGYRTALIGKYLNGYPNDEVGRNYVPPGWDHWFSPNGGTPYNQFNYRVNANGRTLSYGSAPQSHINDVLLAQATSFLRGAGEDPPGKPFFLYLAPYLPHAPATPPQRYADALPGVKAPRTASFNEADVSDKPDWMQYVRRLTADDEAGIDALYRKRRQSTLALDDFVESLVRTLRATGELDNTYVFFTSDNGFHQGQHRLKEGKGWLYEEDIRVPLVVRGPGLPAGRRVSRLVANVDLAPTFADIAGADVPHFVDGRSLLPLLAGASPARWRQALLLESPTSLESGGGGAESAAAAAPGTEAGLLEPADGREAAAHPAWKNHIYRGLRTAGGQTFALYDNGDGEFYDLAQDPHQLVNRYKSMRPALKEALAAQLRVLRGAAGQALRNAEEVLP
ncbi:sulfatase family protein [Azohydromonas lata]|uniref:Sulfatase n=1 Tax=Azohydromonas lata TaxID=45677 RepID=A0ABU5IHC2_9BURK|nr:sulfatase [Azohydromonas lata]MDZ5458545.1 sulfatase [Azohydromonas lata]